MTKTVTYQIDNSDGSIEMYRHDRKTTNQVAASKGEVLGEFVSMLSGELDMLQNNETISITISKKE